MSLVYSLSSFKLRVLYWSLMVSKAHKQFSSKSIVIVPIKFGYFDWINARVFALTGNWLKHVKQVLLFFNFWAGASVCYLSKSASSFYSLSLSCSLEYYLVKYFEYISAESPDTRNRAPLLLDNKPYIFEWNWMKWWWWILYLFFDTATATEPVRYILIRRYWN